MADWNLPALTSNYTDFLNFLKNRDENSAKMFDGTTDTNLPTGTKRWSSANARFEKWSGSAWNELVTLYNINVSKLGGEDSAFYRNASNLNAGTISTSRIPLKQIPYNAHELSDSEDLNDIKTAGFYYQSSSSDTSGNNYPVDVAGSLLVQKSAGAVIQIYTAYNNTRVYSRGYYTSWSTWREVSANTWRDITDSVSSTDSDVSASAKAVKTAYDLATSKLSATAKAVDSDKLDNLDSTQFVRSDVDAETSAKLRVGGIISGLSSSAAILQVNGFQRTGDVLIHEIDGNNLPTNAQKILHNEAGVLQWDGNKIWHAGNDGSGSGLDADKLDNLDSTQFVRSDITTNVSGSQGTISNFTIGQSIDTKPTLTLFAKKYASTHLDKEGVLGTVFVNRGGASASNIAEYANIVVSTAYEDTKLSIQSTSALIKLVTVTYNSEEWYGIRTNAWSTHRVSFSGVKFSEPIFINDASSYSYTEVNGRDYYSNGYKIYTAGNTPTWNQNTTGNAATATNADKLDGIDSTGFAKLGTTANSDTFLYLNRNSADNSVFYVNQENTSGDIARFFQGSTGNTTSSKMVALTNSGGVTATGTVTAPTFNGNLSGNAATATNAANADKLDNLDSTQFVRSDVDAETSAKLRVGGIISGQDSSAAILQVNGFQRTGDVLIHEIDGNNLPTDAYKFLHNEVGVLQWDGNNLYHTGNIPTWNQNTTGNAATATNAANADKLDGLDSTYFLYKNGGTMTGNLIISGGYNLESRGGGGLDSNVSIGQWAFSTNSTGTNNVAVGSSSLYSNTTGTTNVAIGYESLYSNTIGSENISIGHESLHTNISGDANIAIGYNALYSNTSDFNTAIGHESLYSNTSGTNNVAMGYQSLYSNITGKYNTAIGYQSLIINNNDYNTAVGVSSLYNNDTGAMNTALGVSALYNNKTGSNNTAIGLSALAVNQDSSINTNHSNCTGIGNNSKISGDNQVQLGDSNTTTYVYGTVQNRSDKRDKTDIKDTSLGLEFINKIRPVEFKWDMREDYYDEVDEKITRLIPNPKFNPNKKVSKRNKKEIEETFIVKKRVGKEKDGSKIRKRKHQGVIAQEVKKVADNLGVDFGGFQDHSINGGCDVMSIGYDEFIPPLIKAVQELTKTNQELQKRIEALEGKQ